MPRSTDRRSIAVAHRRLLRSCACAWAAVLLALAAAPGALAAGISGNKAFGELATPSAETPTTTTATTRNAGTTNESTSNSQTLILVAAGAAIVLLCGIGFVIVRDARRVAPATEVEAVGGRSARDNAARMAKRRAAAKAARRQRKRNR